MDRKTILKRSKKMREREDLTAMTQRMASQDPPPIQGMDLNSPKPPMVKPSPPRGRSGVSQARPPTVRLVLGTALEDLLTKAIKSHPTNPLIPTSPAILDEDQKMDPESVQKLMTLMKEQSLTVIPETPKTEAEEIALREDPTKEWVILTTVTLMSTDQTRVLARE